MKVNNLVKNNIPKLRFAGFLGEWGEKKLGDVFSKKQERNWNNECKNVFTNSAVRGIVAQSDYFDKDIANQNNLTNYFVVERDDFIYNPRISRYAPVGPLKRNKLQKGIMSPLYTVLNPKVGNITFLEEYFETKYWHRYMYKIANYGARHDRMNILQGDFLKMPVPFPFLPEQQKIALFLGSVDEWISNLRGQKESLEKYKKAMMQKIFSQEIRFKDKNENNFPEWEEKKLGEVIDFLSDYTANGSFASLKDNVQYYSTKNYAVLVRTTDLEKEQFEPQRFTDKKGYEFLKKTSLYGGELILANVGNTGKVYKVPKYDGYMTLAPNTYVIKFKNFMNQEYVYQWMRTEVFINKIAAICGGSGLKAINKTTLRSVSLQTPCIKEQQKIAEFLGSIDNLIESKRQQIAQAEQWKKGLMQGLFV